MPVAKLGLLEGTPIVARDDRVEDGAVGTPLAPGDKLQTGETDRAFIELTDGGQMVVSFDSNVEVTEPARGPGSAGFAVHLSHGQVWAWSPGDGQEISIDTADGSGHIHHGEALVRFYGPEALALRGRGSRLEVTAFRGHVNFADLSGKVRAVSPGHVMLAGLDPDGMSVTEKPLSTMVTIAGAWGARDEVWEMPRLSGAELLSELDVPRASLGVKVVPEPAAARGLQVLDVDRGTNGERAGIRAGDTILQVGTVAVTTVRGLAAAELLLAGETAATVVVRRDEADTSLKFEPVVAPADLCQSASVGLNEVATLVARGEIAEGVEACLRLTAEQPDCASAWLNLGLLREHQGQPVEAIAAYKTADDLAPGQARIRIALGRAYAQRGNAGRATAALLDADDVTPSGLARYLLGRVALLDGDLEGVHQWRKVLLSSPSAEERAWGELLTGYVAYIQSEFAVAALHFGEARALDPANLIAIHYVALATLQMEDLTKTRELLEPLVRVRPDFARALNLMAETAYRSGEFEEAKLWSRRALAVQPDSAAFLCNRAAIALKESEPDEAIVYYTQALAVDPSFVRAHTGLGDAAAEAGERGLAAKHYEEALRLAPGNDRTLRHVVGFYERHGQQTRAERIARHYTLPTPPD